MAISDNADAQICHLGLKILLYFLVGPNMAEMAQQVKSVFLSARLAAVRSPPAFYAVCLVAASSSSKSTISFI